jgi:protein gp37
MKDTKIRWAEHTWNPTTGCDKISPGCDNCYAETITVKFGSTAFPNGFTPTYKPNKLGEPARFFRKSGRARVFVNSMSDLFHADFTDAQRDSIFDVMLDVRHDYLVLTKRPKQMAAYFNGPDGYLARRHLAQAPANMWLGTSIENDLYTFRTKHLTSIPAVVHFLSIEPMLGPVPSLDLTDIEWVIVGGESGPGYRPMDHDWARDIRDRCAIEDVAFYFKQSAAPRTEMGMELDGLRHEEYPLEHPADRTEVTVGKFVGRHGIPVDQLSLT